MGSSPHTRGLLSSLPAALALPGIIPAYAGPTILDNSHRYVYKDHPRIRGAYSGMLLNTGRMAGSSPHTRGLLTVIVTAYCYSRIIPAYAGPTSTSYGFTAFL